jgi:hypothetical protein
MNGFNDYFTDTVTEFISRKYFYEINVPFDVGLD